MGFQSELAKSSPTSADRASFRDVVAYLHGVADAVHSMHRSARSGWPLASCDEPLTGYPAAGDSEPGKSARLTLRFGEAEIELEGMLVLSQPPSPFRPASSRSGTRYVDLEGASETLNEGNDPVLRGTLPYWAPAVSLVPMPILSGGTERPRDLEEHSRSLPYSALALSLVPIAAGVASGWPDEGGDERSSAIRLRSAPLSAEFYALTGTDTWDV